MDPELLIKIAREYGTPVYVYDEGLIRRNYREFYLAFKSRYRDVKVFYAYKANSNLAICHILKEEGAKADVVSGGELKVALKVGLNPRDIIFTSNSKTRQELELAVDSGVVINVDSRDELYRIHEIAEERDKPASVSFRVNPSIDPRTHPKIATGLRESKFGIHLEGDLALNTYRVAMELNNIEVLGVHTHIGSQITCSGVFRDAAEKIMEFVYELHEKLGLRLKFVDLGGGLGINYRGDEKTITPDELAGEIITVTGRWNEKLGYGPELWLEPGRYLVGNAGVLLCEVQGVKETPCRKFINVDAGFTTLARPVLYDAYHRAGVLTKIGEPAAESYDIAGNICESGDILARDRRLPRVNAGDIIAVYDVGAYGFSMSSQYNSRLRPAEVLVWDNSVELIRERESWNDLYEHQIIPKDLK